MRPSPQPTLRALPVPESANPASARRYIQKASWPGERAQAIHSSANRAQRACLSFFLKLSLEVEKHWRRLNGSELFAKVVTGVKFVDGEEQIQEAA
jgi:hypothetical protein